MRAVLSIAVLAGCHGGEAKPLPPQAMPVEIATLQQTKVVDATDYT